MNASGATSELFSVVGSRREFQGRIARVRVDTVVMPGGKTAEREVVEHDMAVAVVAMEDDGRVVLIEQYRHPLRRRLWELPAGLLDVEGELPQPAAARELAEETGLHAGTWSTLIDVAGSPGFCNEIVRVFLATDLTDIGRQGEITDEEADLRVVLVPLADALAGVLQGKVVNAATVAGLLAAHVALSGGDAPVSLRPGDAPWDTAGKGAPIHATSDGDSGDAGPVGAPPLTGAADGG